MVSRLVTMAEELVVADKCAEKPIWSWKFDRSSPTILHPSQGQETDICWPHVSLDAIFWCRSGLTVDSGYPNVGKSSIINCLRGKMVAKVAPIPGETKVWQYVALMKRIHMIEYVFAPRIDGLRSLTTPSCPGIVPPNRLDTPEALLLRGTVRVENVANPGQSRHGETLLSLADSCQNNTCLPFSNV